MKSTFFALLGLAAAFASAQDAAPPVDEIVAKANRMS